jgi:hypothetical protein
MVCPGESYGAKSVAVRRAVSGAFSGMGEGGKAACPEMGAAYAGEENQGRRMC